MKYTLITGGAKNLGSKLAEHLALEGHSVVIQYRNSASSAEEVVQRCRAYGAEAHLIRGNFETIADIEAFLAEYRERFPETKHLVNNAGSYFLGSALHTPQQEWENLLLTNLHLPFMLSKALSGSIIASKGTMTMLGVAGLTCARGDTYSAAYTIAKQALLQLTKSLAKELVAHGVRVNMVSPGYLVNAVDMPVDAKKIPIGYPSTFEEVAKVVSFIINAETITGQNIEIAGGVRL